jgi:microcystin-dependent protein/ribosomal protein S11
LKYSVPNAPDVAYLDQAEPDDFDFQALGNRRTGVVSGGEVTALGTPGPSVQVAAGIALIRDAPVRFNAATVTVANGGGNARFDLIAVSNQGVLVNIAGASSPNALFNKFDFDTFAPLGAVYVPPGSTSVLGGHIILKAPSMPSSFSRVYDTNTDTVVSTVGPSGSLNIAADGTLSWTDSKLRRTAAAAMEWATSLVLKAVDETLSVLVLRARANNPATQKLLQVQGTAANELAYINGEGQLYADNLKFGTGNPNGNVVGRKGDTYVDRAQGGSSTGMWQKGDGDGTTSNWQSFRVYNASESSLPTGALVHSLATSAPVGFIAPVGQWINTSGDTAQLAALIGSRYGSQGGQVRMPDLRGMTLAYAGAGLGLFGSVGDPSVAISVANLPPHTHPLNDPGHMHPQAGPYAYIRPWQFHNNRHPVPSNEPLEHVYTEPPDFNKYAGTGITIGNTGAGTPISMYQPTHAVNLYVKL